LLTGGPGSGKTLLGLNYVVQGAAVGERCVYVSLNETKDELLRACSLIEALSQAEEYVDKKLIFKDLFLGKDVDVKYFIKMFGSYPKIDRLVIDNLNKLLLFSDDKKHYRTSLYELVRYLREKARSSLLLCETDNGVEGTGLGEAYECDGLIHLSFLDVEEKPSRMLSIQKMRYTAIEPRVMHKLVINSKAIKLGKTRAV
jgi:circadian clock protein KaiC